MYSHTSVSKQMKKGILEYVILLMLRKQKMYAGEMIELLQKHNMLVVEGTLYPLLSRLKNDGLLTYSWSESANGPPRKYYRTSEEGNVIVSVMQNVWNNLATTVRAIESLH